MTGAEAGRWAQQPAAGGEGTAGFAAKPSEATKDGAGADTVDEAEKVKCPGIGWLSCSSRNEGVGCAALSNISA